MSIASFSVSEAAIAAQGNAPPVNVRKPPHKRQITAKADATEAPEPR